MPNLNNTIENSRSRTNLTVLMFSLVGLLLFLSASPSWAGGHCASQAKMTRAAHGAMEHAAMESGPAKPGSDFKPVFSRLQGRILAKAAVVDLTGCHACCVEQKTAVWLSAFRAPPSGKRISFVPPAQADERERKFAGRSLSFGLTGPASEPIPHAPDIHEFCVLRL